MITGEPIDRIWDAFWSGGISNPLEVIEQITHLLFVLHLSLGGEDKRWEDLGFTVDAAFGSVA